MRGALYTADGPAAVRAVSDQSISETPQYAGDAALLGLAQWVEGSAAIAERCAAVLRDRGGDGDSDLADELEAALGRQPISLLASVPVDLDELSGQLEGDPEFTGGRIDLRTGEVYPDSYFDDPAAWRDSGDDEEEGEEEEGEDEKTDSDRWLWIDSHGSRAGYQDMVEFRDTVHDQRLAAMLDVALDGRGAFRRFKGVLDDVPAELDRWHRLEDDRRRGRARSWLAGQGYRAAVPREPRHP